MRANLLASSPAHGRFRTSFRHTLKYRSFNSYTKVSSHSQDASRESTDFQGPLWSSRKLVPVVNDEKPAVIIAHEVEQVVRLLLGPFRILHFGSIGHVRKLSEYTGRTFQELSVLVLGVYIRDGGDIVLSERIL